MSFVVEVAGFRTGVFTWLEANRPASTAAPMLEGVTPWTGRHVTSKNSGFKLRLDHQ